MKNKAHSHATGSNEQDADDQENSSTRDSTAAPSDANAVGSSTDTAATSVQPVARRGRKQSLTDDPSKTFVCTLCSRRFPPPGTPQTPLPFSPYSRQAIRVQRVWQEIFSQRQSLTARSYPRKRCNRNGSSSRMGSCHQLRLAALLTMRMPVLSVLFSLRPPKLPLPTRPAALHQAVARIGTALAQHH